MRSRPQQPQGQRPQHDPFRILAIITIILGLVLVIAAFVIWWQTHQQSSLMVGAGLALAGVGGMQRIASYYESQITTPPPPPPPIPPVPPVQPTTPPVTPPADAESGE